MSRKRPTKLVVLSDLHVGSSLGVWPQGYRVRHGMVPSLNHLQKFLYRCWQDGLEWVDRMCPDGYVLGLNGDLIDGVHHRTHEVMSGLVDDHVGACIELLTPVARKARMVVATLGTEAHTGQAEHSIITSLSGTRATDWAPAHNSVVLSINGVTTELMHHIDTAVRPWAEATGHSVAMNVRRAERARLGRETPTVLIRGHRHRFGYFCDGRGLTVVTPSWQALTRWAWKVLPGAEACVGFTVIDYADLEDGVIPKVRFRLYSPKDDRVIHV